MLAYASGITLITIIIHIIVAGLLAWQVYRHASGNMRYSGFILLYGWAVPLSILLHVISLTHLAKLSPK